MNDFVDTLSSLQATPVPNILVWTGVILVLLAFVGRFGTFVELTKDRQRSAIILGFCFLFFGIILFILPHNSSSSATTTSINTTTSASPVPSDIVTSLPTTTNMSTPAITIEVPTQTVNPSPSSIANAQPVIAIDNQTIENFDTQQVSLAVNEVLIGTADRYQDLLDQNESQFTVFVIYGPINTELSLYWGGWDQWANASPKFIEEQLAIKVREIQTKHPNDIKTRGYRIIECSGSVLACNIVESVQPVTVSTDTIDWQEKEMCRGENKACVVPISVNGLCALYFYRRGQSGAVEKTFIFRAYQDVSIINFSGVLYCWQYIPSKEVVAGGHEFATLSEVEAAGISFDNFIEEIEPSILLQ